MAGVRNKFRTLAISGVAEDGLGLLADCCAFAGGGVTASEGAAWGSGEDGASFGMLGRGSFGFAIATGGADRRAGPPLTGRRGAGAEEERAETFG